MIKQLPFSFSSINGDSSISHMNQPLNSPTQPCSDHSSYSSSSSSSSPLNPLHNHTTTSSSPPSISPASPNRRSSSLFHPHHLHNLIAVSAAVSFTDRTRPVLGCLSMTICSPAGGRSEDVIEFEVYFDGIQDPRFKPEKSSTYTPVKCNINCRCDERRNNCIYDRRYAEQSSSSGVLGDDIVSFGSESELKSQRVVFGCENSESGDLFTQRADGIIGLGRGPLSIVDQLVNKGAIDNYFSLCYGGMDLGGGAMILGAHELPSDMVFARSDRSRSQYYNIDLKEIYVAGKLLNLKPSAFDGNHGTVLDSGTTYAYLPKEAYSAFKSAILESVRPLIRTPGPDPSYQDICLGGAGRDVSQLSRTFPQVEMVFGNGQKLSLSPENYLFRHTKVPGAYCLGIFPNGNDQTTLLGGIIVRNTLVTYDRENERVGFWKTSCSDLWKSLNAKHSPAPSPSVDHGKNTSFGSTPVPSPFSGIPAKDIFSGDFRVGVITFEMTLLTDDSSLKPNMTELGSFIANGLDIDFSQVRMLNFTSEGSHYHIRWDMYPVDSASYITSTQAKSIIRQLTGHHLKLPVNFGSYEIVEWTVEPQAKRKPQFLAVFIGSFAILAIILSLIGIWFLRRCQKQRLHPYEPVDSVVAEQELQPLSTQLS